MSGRIAHAVPMPKNDASVNLLILSPTRSERGEEAYTTRSTSIFLTSAMALAGFRPFGQTWAQFMIVWQR